MSRNLANALTGQVGSSLIANLGIPFEYFQITPGDVTRGLAGTEVAVGKQYTVLGVPAFLTVSPRLCGKLNPVNLGASLEFRVSREWRVAASIDPARTCGVLAGQPVTTNRQAGVDLLWEKSY